MRMGKSWKERDVQRTNVSMRSDRTKEACFLVNVWGRHGHLSSRLIWWTVIESFDLSSYRLERQFFHVALVCTFRLRSSSPNIDQNVSSPTFPPPL
jgi:hypothetical protein